MSAALQIWSETYSRAFDALPGRTWITGNMISENSGGYSDAAVLPDKTILTLYENARDDSQPKGLARTL